MNIIMNDVADSMEVAYGRYSEVRVRNVENIFAWKAGCSIYRVTES